MDQSKKIFREGIVDFPVSAWSKTLYARKLESSDGVVSSAVRVSIPSVKATVVLKGSATVAQDWLGQLLVKSALGPSAAPAARLLEYSNREWEEAKKSVLKNLPQASGLDRPVLTLMSFVDAVPIDSLAGGVYARYLLRQLGALCVVDGCIGNFDRLPVGEMFSNEGNCSNALVDYKGHLVAIDTAVSLPVDGTSYVRRLDAWLKNTPEKKWEQTIAALEQTNGPAPAWVAQTLEEGGVRALAALVAVLSPENLERVFEELLQATIKQDWENVWRDSVTACRKNTLIAIGQMLKNHSGAGPMVSRPVGPCVLTLEATLKGLEDAITQCPSLPDVVLLPECWGPPGCKNNTLHEATVAAAAKKFGVYIVGGSYTDTERRVISPFFDPTGALVARYAKRTLAKKLGDLPGIFHIALGRVSLLICNDVEISTFVDEAADSGAWLILNPCFVGAGDTLELLQRRLVGQAVTRNLAFARTDIGPGTAMCVCAGYTFLGAGMCRLETTRAEWRNVPEPSRHRSTPEDNCGNRYIVRRRTKEEEGGEGKQGDLLAACTANSIPEVPFHCIEGLAAYSPSSSSSSASSSPYVITFAQHNVPTTLAEIRAGTVKI